MGSVSENGSESVRVGQSQNRAGVDFVVFLMKEAWHEIC
jgi:hypothetical protein